jgi:hypothetical protein
MKSRHQNNAKPCIVSLFQRSVRSTGKGHVEELHLPEGIAGLAVPKKMVLSHHFLSA